MKNKLTKVAVAAVLAGGLALGGASAASAYTPVAPGGSTAVVAPGASVAISVNVSSLPAEDASVVFTLTGEGVTGANLATIVKAAPTSASVTKPRSNPTVTVKLPTNAQGSYSLAAKGATSGTALPAVTIPSGVPLAGGSGGGIDTSGENSMALLGLWVGGGALVLAGGALVVGNAVRRQRTTAGV